MLEMADMGVTVRLSVTVYVTTPCTNPLAPPAPESGRTHWIASFIGAPHRGHLVSLTSVTWLGLWQWPHLKNPLDGESGRGDSRAQETSSRCAMWIPGARTCEGRAPSTSRCSHMPFSATRIRNCSPFSRLDRIMHAFLPFAHVYPPKGTARVPSSTERSQGLSLARAQQRKNDLVNFLDHQMISLIKSNNKHILFSYFSLHRSLARWGCCLLPLARGTTVLKPNNHYDY
jgi:hypothetical protein